MPTGTTTKPKKQAEKRKGHEYTFSKKVDMSVEKAKQKLKADADKPLSNLKRRAASTFVQKLYRDDDELNDLKVLAGEGNFDSDIEEELNGNKERKRDAKLASKQGGIGGSKAAAAKVLSTTKVGKLVSVPKPIIDCKYANQPPNFCRNWRKGVLPCLPSMKYTQESTPS